MFKFDFNLEELEDDADILNIHNEANDDATPDIDKLSLVPFNVISILDLISSLPPAISYSPVKIQRINSPSSENSTITLFRRDLFDARFQLISEDNSPPDGCDNNVEYGNHNGSLSFVDALSDLVAGVYEGGLKTWECSVDLAAYLADLDLDSNMIVNNEFSILEQAAFYSHISDDNSSPRLQLRSLKANSSPASEAYRRTSSEEQDSQPSDIEPGSLELTKELIAAFQKSLADYRIEFRFINGSWQDTSTWISENQTKFNLILSSETVYRISSLPHLINLLQHSVSSSKSVSNMPPPLCLIAAKVVYFGVGGGVESFVKAVIDSSGCSETVFETKTGVSRKIMKISW